MVDEPYAWAGAHVDVGKPSQQRKDEGSSEAISDATLAVLHVLGLDLAQGRESLIDPLYPFPGYPRLRARANSQALLVSGDYLVRSVLSQGVDCTAENGLSDNLFDLSELGLDSVFDSRLLHLGYQQDTLEHTFASDVLPAASSRTIQHRCASPVP